MTGWLLAAVAGWLAVATPLGVLVGRGIRLADQGGPVEVR